MILVLIFFVIIWTHFTSSLTVYLWQLGRENVFPNLWIPANLNTLMSNLFNITNGDLQDVSHSESACFELPIIEAGQPVILPGQCNEDIVGVANFQAARVSNDLLWT